VPTFTIRLFLEAESDSATAIHGLRWLLKVALRRYRLKCTSVAETKHRRAVVQRDGVPSTQHRNRS
jgi:hypothetical protein